MAQDIGIKVGLSLDTPEGLKQFNDWSNKVHSIAQKNPIKVDLVLNGQQYEKQIETFIAANRDLAQVTTYTNKATGEQTMQVTKTASAFEQCASAEQKLVNTNKNLSNTQQQLNTQVSRSKTLFADFADTFMKMAKFNTINIIYDKIVESMSEAIKITEDFDVAMTEFKKVTDTTNLSLSEYTDTLGELGEATARSATQMLEASTQFAKSGYDAETSAQLAQVATLFQNIADSEVSAGDAASFIISQMKAFGIEAKDATSILDKINEVSNTFSVSSTDITSALTKQSASLAAYGNDLSSSIALVTAGTEIMTGQAGKVARGLRTIGANITQLAQESKEFEIQVDGATRTIQLWNDAGTDMLSTYSVLKQISVYWNEMTNAEKSSLAITLAKKTQMDTFLATMSNFADAEKAYVTALTSEGSAWKENTAYMESIEAHQAKLQAQWEKLVLSLPIETIEKSLLNLGTVVLQLANNDFVKLLAVFTLLNTSLNVFSKGIVGIKTSITSWMALQYGLGASISATTVAVDLLTKAVLTNPIFWGAAAVTAVIALYKGLNYLATSYERNAKALNELNDEYKSATEEAKTYEEQLKSLKEQIEINNNLALEITNKEQLNQLRAETNELIRQEAVLQNQLAITKAKAKATQEEAKNKAEKLSNKQITRRIAYMNSSKDIYGNEDVLNNTSYASEYSFQGTPQEVFAKEINGLKEVQEAIAHNNHEYEILMQNEDENSEAIEKLTQKNQDLKDYFDRLQSSIAEDAETMEDFIKAGVGESDVIQGLLDDFSSLVNWNTNATDTTQQLIDGIEDETDGVNEANNAWDSFLDNIESIQSAYEILNKAVEEYNSNGFITASTLKKLNKLQPEYIAQLEITNGKMEIGNTLLQDEFNREKELAINAVLVAKQLRVQAVCQQYLNEKTEDAKTASENAAPKIDELKTSFNQLALEAQKAGRSVQFAYAAIANDKNKQDSLKAQLDEIDDWADGMIDSINAVSLGTAKTASKSASSSKDAWVEAFEEEQRQLKHALEMNEITEMEYYDRLKDLNEKYFGEISGKHQQYIKEYQENEEEIYKGTKAIYDKVKDYLKEAVEQGYEKAINAIKKEEKNVLAEIKSQIEALKKEKNSVLDGIKDQVNALKKEKEAVQKYYNDQIDAIKKENEVLQEQNQLLEYQQALQQAKAQKVMIFQDGKFQLGENESAVAQAEQNLAQYQDQMSYEQQIQQLEDLRDAQVESIEARIESLEEYYDYMEDYYDKQIESMEEYYNQVQEQYEKQIEALQTELDAFKDGYQKAEDLENAKLAATVLAANEEASVWQKRLENLATAVSEYNRILDMIGEGNVQSTFAAEAIVSQASSKVAEVDASIVRRASGDASFKDDGIALVGESPNTELVLGSKINNLGGGQLMNLTKGSGVVNAESTATLAGLLNGLSNPTVSNTSRTVQQNFSFGSISLPSVTDGNSFVKTLSTQFNNYAIQYSTMKH